MNDETALLSAIIANPEEDTPRLVYADWLQEHGQEERAEFIRVQIALARTSQFLPSECKVCGATADEEGTVSHGRGCYVLDEDGGGSEPADENPEWEKLRKREAELLTESNSGQWAGHPLSTARAHATMPMFYPWQFVRGFVHSVFCSASDWDAHSAAILAANPVTSVALADEPNELDFGTIHEIDWQTRKVKYFRWPKIEFTLPPTPTPEPPRIPLSNWRCNYRERSEEPVESIHRGYALGQGVRHLDLEIRLPGAAHAFRELLGQQFGPLTATDDNGGRWVCEAILMNATTDASRRELTTILTARSVAYPILVSLG